MIEMELRKILLLYLRQYFSVTKTENQDLSIIYKFLFCCLYPLQPTLDGFNSEIEKIIAISKLNWVKSSMEAFLNDYYDDTQRRIFFGFFNLSEPVYLGSQEDNDGLPFGSQEDNDGVFLGSEHDGYTDNYLYLSVPNSIYTDTDKLRSLVADMNYIKPMYIYVTIISQ